MRVLEPLEQEIYKLAKFDTVESIEIDDDDLSEGFLHVHIAISEDKLDKVLEDEYE